MPALLVFQDSKPILVALSWTGLEKPMVTDDASGLLPYYSFFEIETKVLIWIPFCHTMGMLRICLDDASFVVFTNQTQSANHIARWCKS